MIGGRLTLARDGRSRLPYASGISPACAAAQTTGILLFFTAEFFSGGSATPPTWSCERELPRIYLIQLESRRGAVLVVQPDGLYTAKLPTGTYLMAAIDDDGKVLLSRLAFQAAVSGDAYDLGNLAVNYSGILPGTKILDLTVSPNPPEILDPAFARYAAGRTLGIHTRPPIRISNTPPGMLGGQGQDFYFQDDASWNAYIAAAIAELQGKGIKLLTADAGSATPPQ
jgi:hypothetical protein